MFLSGSMGSTQLAAYVSTWYIFGSGVSLLYGIGDVSITIIGNALGANKVSQAK